MVARYFPQYCSYTAPKRLPKKRNRPTTSAFRAAAAHLDFINSLSGEFKIPAIVDLRSDSEGDLVRKQTSKSTSSRDNAAKKEEGSKAFAERNSKRKSRRRVICDSDDEAESHPTVSATTPQRTRIKSHQLKRSPDSRCLGRANSYLSATIDVDGRPAKKAKTNKQRLAAEMEDLEIDMEGWELPELFENTRATRILRSTTRSKTMASAELVDTFEDDERWGSSSPCQTGESDTPPPPLAGKVLRRIQDADTAPTSRRLVRNATTRLAAHGNAAYLHGGVLASESGGAKDNGHRHGKYGVPRLASPQFQYFSKMLTDEQAERELQQRVEEQMLDMEDVIHTGCDIPLNSIEDADASS